MAPLTGFQAPPTDVSSTKSEPEEPIEKPGTLREDPKIFLPKTINPVILGEPVHADLRSLPPDNPLVDLVAEMDGKLLVSEQEVGRLKAKHAETVRKLDESHRKQVKVASDEYKSLISKQAEEIEGLETRVATADRRADEDARAVKDAEERAKEAEAGRNEYVPVPMTNGRLAALNKAMAEYARRYPGSLTVIEAIEAYADQFEAGQPKPAAL